MMDETITLSIDGKEVTAAAGTSILKAAAAAGIEIPTLCHHPKLQGSGTCRICVVGVTGMSEPVRACVTPVESGMTVTTAAEYLDELRRKSIADLLRNHPLDCPICPKAGECRLQDLVYALGVRNCENQIPPVALDIDTSSPLIERNNNRCIRCGRCVSVCDEIQAAFALKWQIQGDIRQVVPVNGYPLNCEFCGQCIAACPVGAIGSRLFSYKARVWELDRVSSVCPYCGAGCSIELNVRKNRILRVTSDSDATHNKGYLCCRGVFGYGFIQSSHRLHTPLLRRRNEKIPVSWTEVLESAASNLKRIVEMSGPSSIAGLGSPRVSNEDNYVFQKLLRAGIGTNNIDSVAHFTYRAVQRGLMPTIGFPAGTLGFGGITKGQTIFVIGADVHAEMPPASMQIIRAVRFGGSRLVVANPRSTKLDAWSEVRLRYRPGSELLVAIALAQIIIEKGWEHTPFISSAAGGYHDFKKSLRSIALETISELSGVPMEDLVTVSRILSEGDTGCILFGLDAVTHRLAENVVAALANLALLTGKIGREGSGLMPVMATNNAQGMLDMGITPDLLPGYQPYDRKAPFERAWGKTLSSEPGKNSTEILEGVENGSIHGLYVMGCNPLQEFPEPGRWRAALKKLNWLAVQDVFPTETTDLAHYVFPAATFAERPGSFTSAERRVQVYEAALEPQYHSLPDWHIIQKLSHCLGYPMDDAHPASVMREIAALVPAYSAAGYEGLGRNGILWGYADTGDPSFIPLEQLSMMYAPLAVELPANSDDEKDFVLVTGSAFFHSGSLSTHAQGLMVLADSAWVDVNDLDARRRDLIDGDLVTLQSDSGSITAAVKSSSQVPTGVVFVPSHFPGVAVNALLGGHNSCRVTMKKR
ncbi:MAG TPA: molybdopterin-dependent oxidoreductase [Thermodesulfobacteriota bacterium]|nr:molybdopterin-dependent oxidoreductase [Thermodesulfobacteriota bacterium]